jgi:hypothetical protein
LSVGVQQHLIFCLSVCLSSSWCHFCTSKIWFSILRSLYSSTFFKMTKKRIFDNGMCMLDVICSKVFIFCLIADIIFFVLVFVVNFV